MWDEWVFDRFWPFDSSTDFWPLIDLASNFWQIFNSDRTIDWRWIAKMIFHQTNTRLKLRLSFLGVLCLFTSWFLFFLCGFFEPPHWCLVQPNKSTKSNNTSTKYQNVNCKTNICWTLNVLNVYTRYGYQLLMFRFQCWMMTLYFAFKCFPNVLRVTIVSIPGVLTISEDPDMLAELVENHFLSRAPAFMPWGQVQRAQHIYRDNSCQECGHKNWQNVC